MTDPAFARLAPDNQPAAVVPPAYDRTAARVGVVHFGLGAFARAHLTWYTDRAMAADGGDWMIAGVSLRSPDVGAQLNPQAGLYTLVEKSAAGDARQVIGSVREVLDGSRQRDDIVARLAAPATQIVSFTVTEKGYCRRADGSLDLALADSGFYPLLAAAVARRQAAGIAGLTLLSCDNLAGNGPQLGRLVGDYLAARAPELRAWFAEACRCPSTMVDRIVPATTPADRAANDAAMGYRDDGVVVTEPFSQWVIEDAFAGGRPAWEKAGAQFVADVAPFETAKLRLLNGAHSALAYLGLRAGYAYVHEAVGDPALRAAVRALMHEAAPTIPAAAIDLDAYASALLARFANPALDHRLIQIAMDGSEKIPQRWLATLAANRRAGRASPALLTAVAAWLCHVRGDNDARWGAVEDPRADTLAAAWRRHGTGVVDAVFGVGGIIASDWHPTAAERDTIAGQLARARVAA